MSDGGEEKEREKKRGRRRERKDGRERMRKIKKGGRDSPMSIPEKWSESKKCRDEKENGREREREKH